MLTKTGIINGSFISCNLFSLFDGLAQVNLLLLSDLGNQNKDSRYLRYHFYKVKFYSTMMQRVLNTYGQLKIIVENPCQSYFYSQRLTLSGLLSRKDLGNQNKDSRYLRYHFYKVKFYSTMMQRVLNTYGQLKIIVENPCQNPTTRFFSYVVYGLTRLEMKIE